MGTSNNPKLCVTLHRQNVHCYRNVIPNGIHSIASLDFKIIRSALIFFFFSCGGILCAQDKGIATIPPPDAIQSYLSETQKNAALYNGKVETPYDHRFENHPYLETDQFVKGTLCYNHVVYQDIFMRFDLYRDELTVFSPDKPYRIVLDKEKFDYAVLNPNSAYFR